VKGLARFCPFLIECLSFFSNFIGHFWPFFTEGLTFFEKMDLATPCFVISVFASTNGKEKDHVMQKM